MLAKMLAARPESARLVLNKYMRDYHTLTGKTPRLDYDQEQELQNRAGANAQGVWTSSYSQLPLPWYQVQSVFCDGFRARTTSESLSKDLELAEAFYSLLDKEKPSDKKA
jgi:hypothetical protein